MPECWSKLLPKSLSESLGLFCKGLIAFTAILPTQSISAGVDSQPFSKNYQVLEAPALPFAYNLTFGSPSAPIKIVMYFSPTCSHCSEYEEKILPEIDEQFIKTGKVYLVICLLPFHRLDYAVAKLIYKSSNNPLHYHQLIKLFLAHQKSWLEPLMQDPKAQADLLTEKLAETAKQLNLPVEVLERQAEIKAGDDSAFLKLFALQQGFTLQQLSEFLEDDLDLEETLTANHIQAAAEFGRSLDRVPAFVVNDKPVKDLVKPKDIKKLLKEIQG